MPSYRAQRRQPTEADRMQYSALAQTDIFDVKEFRFFSFRGGLARYGNELQASITFDYELVRESQALIDFILECADREERARSYLKALPDLARWAPNLKSGQLIESPELAPRIPTVSLITPWFPARWLAGTKKDRGEIVKELARAYAPVRPVKLYSYPLTAELERRLGGLGKPLYVIALDGNEPFATTARVLESWRLA